MKWIGFIPARAGSKGLPGKNKRMFAGKPLIAWTILAAKQSSTIDEIVVSTDDAEIADISEQYGGLVPFLRPEYLADDRSATIDVVLHAAQKLDWEKNGLVLLQPTSPLRRPHDIEACIELLNFNNCSTCISVQENTKPLEWLYSLDKKNVLAKVFNGPEVSRRQDAATFVVPNGAVYAGSVAALMQTRQFVNNDTIGYLMPKERSLDIDDVFDFQMAEALFKAQLNGSIC